MESLRVSRRVMMRCRGGGLISARGARPSAAICSHQFVGHGRKSEVEKTRTDVASRTQMCVRADGRERPGALYSFALAWPFLGVRGGDGGW